jgi:hypothetical protein
LGTDSFGGKKLELEEFVSAHGVDIQLNETQSRWMMS